MRNHKLRIAVIIILVVFGLLTCVLLRHRVRALPRVHKFVMPGKYNVDLHPDGYQVWVYRVWRSKHVESPADLSVHFSIVDSRHDLIQQDSMPQPHLSTADWGEFDDPSRRGLLEGYVTIKQRGIYKISSADRCVLVLVPKEAGGVNVGSRFYYDSMDDDENFD